jgi:hypothetical protein
MILENSKMFAKDIIEAAKSDQAFDKINAEEISSFYGIDYNYVVREISFVRELRIS